MDGGRGCGDVGVDDFAEANLVSFAAWDLIVHLQRDPEATWTEADLCSALARPMVDLEPALNHCVSTGVVKRRVGSDETVRYGLSEDGETRRIVARFAQLVSVRQTRLDFVRVVLGGH